MIEARYQYWGRDGITWTNWFQSYSNKSLKELQRKKPIIKNLKEEYREV